MFPLVYLSPYNFLYSKYIYHQAAVIKTSWLRKYHYDTKFRIIADQDFFRKVYFLEGIKDAAIDFILSNYDGSGISSTNLSQQEKEREESFHDIMVSPMICDDYHRFFYGESLSEKYAARINRNPCFAALAIALLFPYYLLCSLLFFLVSNKFFIGNIKKFWQN